MVASLGEVAIFLAIIGGLLVRSACDFEVRTGANETLCGAQWDGSAEHDKALEMRSALSADFFAIDEVLGFEGIEAFDFLGGVVVYGETPSCHLLTEIMRHWRWRKVC